MKFRPPGHDFAIAAIVWMMGGAKQRGGLRVNGIVERLSARLPREAARLLLERGDSLTQIRLRADRPPQLIGEGFAIAEGPPLSAGCLRDLLSALMEHSVYARQEELDRGFFTLEDGSRVGVCGRMVTDGARIRMGEIGSACIRVARQLPGCADSLVKRLLAEEGLPSTLLVSPPGRGKTTLLRDLARSLSTLGRCVGIADERHELAACRRGVPTLDVGPCADVMDGCPRAEAIGWMLRAMSPEVIVVDEIGGPADAAALEDAVRCGVAVMATAHGGSFAQLRARTSLRELLDSGTMAFVALLGPRPGQLRELWRREGGEGAAAWRRA